MSLMCWLPLNNNIKNYGCSLDVFTGSPSFDNNGKIGKCLDCYTTLAATSSFSINSQFSICCWVKIGENANSGWLIKIKDKGIWIDYDNSLLKLNNNNNNNDTENLLPANSTLFNNKWHHLVITINNLIITLYIDGIKLTESNLEENIIINENEDIIIGDSNLTNTYINDVRIYNHCLSNVEIAEITRGLVLHWKLDHLNSITSDSSGYNNRGIISGTFTEFSTSRRYSKAIHFDNNSYIKTGQGSFSWYKMLEEGTISAWIRARTQTDRFGNIGLVIMPENVDPNENNKIYRTISLTNYNNKLQLMYSNGNDFQLINTGKDLENEIWHFCAIAFKSNGLVQIYYDGEKVREESLIGWNNTTINDNIQFLAGLNLKDNNNNNFEGEYSDIRFYTTSLLDKDIKMLYNTSMRIDNFGRIHAFSFEEINTGISKLTLTGVLKAKSDINLEQHSIKHGINEDGNITKLTSNYEWYSPNFIEY